MLRTILLCLFAAAAARANSVYYVTVDTTALGGTTGDVVFDFLSGGGPADNALPIEGFTTDGTLGTPTTTGTVIEPFGPLPNTVILVTDPNTSPFNEYLTGFTFGTTMSFLLNATENAPGPGSAPDEFSMYFLAADGMTSLITTSDPTGADTLLTLDLDGSPNGIPTVYTVSDPFGISATMTLNGGPSAVPEPSEAWCVFAGILLIGISRAAGRVCRHLHRGC